MSSTKENSNHYHLFVMPVRLKTAEPAKSTIIKKENILSNCYRIGVEFNPTGDSTYKYILCKGIKPAPGNHNQFCLNSNGTLLQP